MELIEDFEGKIAEIERLRNLSSFSDALLRDEELKQEYYELASRTNLMNEDYPGQIFVDPIQAGFGLLPVEMQREMSRVLYEGAKTAFDLNDIGALKDHMAAWEMRIETVKFAKNDEYRSLDAAYSALEVVRVRSHFFGGTGPPEITREAEVWIRRAIDICDDVFHLGRMYHNLGLLLYLQGKIADAITAFEKALELQKESGDKRGGALTRARRGKCYIDMAREDYERAFQDFYDDENKSRVSEQRKDVRDFGEFFERLFREREKVSYDNAGGWEIKPAEVPDSENVDYSPHTGVIVVTSYLVDDMEAADEHLFDEGTPEVLFSLLPYKFLDGQRDKYIELTEFLNLYDGCNYEAREKMKVDRINWWIGKISDTSHLAGVQLSDFETEEERKGFVRKTLRRLYKALYQSFVLARTSEIIVEPASLKKISQLWIDYMLESSFLDDLERLALDVVERFGFEPETEEDRYAFTTEAVKKIFDLKDTQVADGFPEIIKRQEGRGKQQVK